MSTAETACHASPEQAGLRVETLPFDQIPQQSKLFLDYLRDPLALRHFYPEAVRAHVDLPARKDRVLSSYVTDRQQLCAALERLNRGWGASEATLNNIRLLAESDCVAVVSGQQAGLFTGPLYTIYKALSAVKLAECLSQRGVKAVPVFWIATEDHDFAEVASAEFINRDCALAKVAVPAELHNEGSPVGMVKLDQSNESVIENLLKSLPNSEFTEDVGTLLRDAYAPGTAYGDAFARLVTALTAKHGLVVLDPLDAELKKLAAPLYSAAARIAPEIAAAITHRSRELEEAGYHAQVTPSEDSFPLFLHDETAARHALSRTPGGKYRTKTGGQEYSAEELAEWALREPDRFSPNVTLRSVVQDYLLPTITYYGGAAEIAYFAQTSEVYRLLDRPVTPILHRASLTMVEKQTWRALERYDLTLKDFFAGYDQVVANVVENYLGKETSEAFDHTTETFDRELDALQERLRQVDPTLADALDKGRAKIKYQLDGLRTRFQRAQIGRDETLRRQLERAFDLLYPEKTLQERHINIASLLARHGRYVVDWMFDAIDLGSNEHTIVYL
ncbi:MAG TPA: bacillithiol biosynthesis cysteine-adding enzyme BshC [Pyrinomonadaceae bacterium]|nr:bacillithiol biosynthesis cysteine-adding enzyme BshC [Pyrinomonadaceae bacterium]